MFGEYYYVHALRIGPTPVVTMDNLPIQCSMKIVDTLSTFCMCSLVMKTNDIT